MCQLGAATYGFRASVCAALPLNFSIGTKVANHPTVPPSGPTLCSHSVLETTHIQLPVDGEGLPVRSGFRPPKENF